MQIKQGVELWGLTREIWNAYKVVRAEFEAASRQTTITSGREGVHSRRSYHYTGDALDFRTRHLEGDAAGRNQLKGIILRIKEALPAEYDVIYHEPRTISGEKRPGHLHVEYDRRRAETVV